MKGGYRDGAGRKKGFAARSSEEARKIFSEMLMKEIEPIAKALINKAKKGDVTAARELFDRSWGKPGTTESGGYKQLWGFTTTIEPQEDLLQKYLEQAEEEELAVKSLALPTGNARNDIFLFSRNLA